VMAEIRERAPAVTGRRRRATGHTAGVMSGRATVAPRPVALGQLVLPGGCAAEATLPATGGRPRSATTPAGPNYRAA
jgi:hypothetical protein